MNDGNPGTPQRYGKAMIYIAWLLALGLLTAGFNRWLNNERNPNQHVLSSRSAEGARVALERNRYGHYLASGSINGRPVEFMLDTGATVVAVPGRLADRLGLRQGPEIQVATANGAAIAYATRLDELRVGDIVLTGVRAQISPTMDGDEVLLGMSALKNLDFTQHGGTLTLKQHVENQ